MWKNFPYAQVVDGRAPSWSVGLATAGESADSLIRPFLTGRATVRVREEVPSAQVFDEGWLRLETAPIHTVRALEVSVPEQAERSEERRVGKECRSRWSPYH